MRKDSSLAEKAYVERKDLLGVPLICSRQAILPQREGNEFAGWFGEDFEKLDIVTTFNLVYNASLMVESGIGYAITLDRLVNTAEGSALCFRPLRPRLESALNIVWKKYQVFSPAAELFLERLKSRDFSGS